MRKNTCQWWKSGYIGVTDEEQLTDDYEQHSYFVFHITFISHNNRDYGFDKTIVFVNLYHCSVHNHHNNIMLWRPLTNIILILISVCIRTDEFVKQLTLDIIQLYK